MVCAAGAVALAWPIAAQNTTTPPVITLPGVQDYSLPPGTPTPQATPTIAPPPVRVTVPSPTPTPAPTSVRADAPAARVTPAPVAAPTAAPTPVPLPTPDGPPAAVPSPDASAVPAPTPTAPIATAPPAQADGGTPLWSWLAGGVALALLAGAAYLWRRRRAPELDESVEPAAAIAEPPAPTPEPVPAASAAPTVELRAIELATQGPDALLRFELVLRNDAGVPLEAVRPVVVLGSAGPTLAREIASFHASAPTMNAAAQFDLAPGEARRLTGELTLPGTAMHVSEVAGRAMIVPVVLVDLRWRSGLSVRADGAAFLVGTGTEEASRLGPIWVDRTGQRFTRIAARRFVPEAQS